VSYIVRRNSRIFNVFRGIFGVVCGISNNLFIDGGGIRNVKTYFCSDLNYVLG
jgi:hypothetical protein